MTRSALILILMLLAVPACAADAAFCRDLASALSTDLDAANRLAKSPIDFTKSSCLYVARLDIITSHHKEAVADHQRLVAAGCSHPSRPDDDAWMDNLLKSWVADAAQKADSQKSLCEREKRDLQRDAERARRDNGDGLSVSTTVSPGIVPPAPPIHCFGNNCGSPDHLPPPPRNQPTITSKDWGDKAVPGKPTGTTIAR